MLWIQTLIVSHFGVWQFLKTDHSTGAKTNFDYYATLAVDRLPSLVVFQLIQMFDVL